MAQKVRSCGIITLGAVIYALAFDWFVAPNQIAMGGVTGLAQIVNALVPVLPVGVLSILVNVPLFLAGWRLLGGRLLVSSLYAMAVPVRRRRDGGRAGIGILPGGHDGRHGYHRQAAEAEIPLAAHR